MSRKVLYLVGPTCSGKTTIAEALVEKYGYGLVKSAMTRQSRNANDNNIFLDRDRFKDLIAQDEFVEYATYSNEYYGTLRESIFDSFKDNNELAVKVIEVNGLTQIIKSGFHESSGIDFFIVYLKPQFEGYETHLKTRSDWEQRVEEDNYLYYTFLKTIRTFVPKKKFKVIGNRGDLNKVVSYVNMLCLLKDRSYGALRSILKIPDYVQVDSKNDGNLSYTVSLIDPNYSTNTQNFILKGSSDFNAVRYMSEAFGNDVHYEDEDYIAIGLKNNGMLAVVSKEDGVGYLRV